MNKKILQKKSFTMAEILISLTIIGVIAAITLPALQANINERTWATKRKALFSRISQAISMMPSMNGYGEYEGNYLEDNVISVTKDSAATTFITAGLSNVLKINNICSVPVNTTSDDARSMIFKCGINSVMTTMANSKINFPTSLNELNPSFASHEAGTDYINLQRDINTVVAAFETNNGESIALFYNPLCVAADMGYEFIPAWYYTEPYVCANFVYDLNGLKGPNKFGKDIGFITAMYSTDTITVAPMPLEKNAQNGAKMVHTQTSAACRAMDSDSRVPNKDEAAAMFYNMQLIGLKAADQNLWTSTVFDSTGSVWCQDLETGSHGARVKTLKTRLRCVKR